MVADPENDGHRQSSFDQKGAAERLRREQRDPLRSAARRRCRIRRRMRAPSVSPRMNSIAMNGWPSCLPASKMVTMFQAEGRLVCRQDGQLRS